MSTIEEEDRESQIGNALFGQIPPDVRPLVELLRSNRPIPDGIRDMLAQMIDPEIGGYLFLRLDLKDTQGKVRNQARDIKTFEIAQYHAALVATGKSANQAATETGAKFGIEQRSVYERLREAKSLSAWLKGDA